MDINGLHTFDLKQRRQTILRIHRQFRIFFFDVKLHVKQICKRLDKKLQKSNYEM